VAGNVVGAVELRWKALALLALQEVPVVYSDVKVILNWRQLLPFIHICVVI